MESTLTAKQKRRDARKTPTGATPSSSKHVVKCLRHRVAAKMKLRYGRWSDSEVAVLHRNADDFVKKHGVKDIGEFMTSRELRSERKKTEFISELSRGLQRTAVDIRHKARRTLDPLNHCGKFSAAERKLLAETAQSRAAEGNHDWTTLRKEFGRSNYALERKARKMRNDVNSGLWSEEELQRLSEAVHGQTKTELGEAVFNGINWVDVSNEVGTRGEDQCRNRWISKSCWLEQERSNTPADSRRNDAVLVNSIVAEQAVSEEDLDWDQLYDNITSARSPYELRHHWYRLKRTVPQYQYLTFHEIVTSLHHRCQQNAQGSDDNIGQMN